jgi:hypothetical protein
MMFNKEEQKSLKKIYNQMILITTFVFLEIKIMHKKVNGNLILIRKF